MPATYFGLFSAVGAWHASSLFLSFSRSIALSVSMTKNGDSRGPVHGFLLNFVARERRCPLSEHGEEEARRSVHHVGRNSSFSLGCHLAENPYKNKDVGQLTKKIIILFAFWFLRYPLRHTYMSVCMYIYICKNDSLISIYLFNIRLVSSYFYFFAKHLLHLIAAFTFGNSDRFTIYVIISLLICY